MRRFSELIQSLVFPVQLGCVLVSLASANLPMVQAEDEPAAVVTTRNGAPVDLPEEPESQVMSKAVVLRRTVRRPQPADSAKEQATKETASKPDAVKEAAAKASNAKDTLPKDAVTPPAVELLPMMAPSLKNVEQPDAAAEQSPSLSTPTKLPASTESSLLKPASLSANIEQPQPLSTSETQPQTQPMLLGSPILAPAAPAPDSRRLERMLSVMGLTTRVSKHEAVSSDTATAPNSFEPVNNAVPSSKANLQPRVDERFALAVRTLGFTKQPVAAPLPIQESRSAWGEPLANQHRGHRDNVAWQPSVERRSDSLGSSAVRNSDFQNPVLAAGTKPAASLRQIEFSQPVVSNEPVSLNEPAPSETIDEKAAPSAAAQTTTLAESLTQPNPAENQSAIQLPAPLPATLPEPVATRTPAIATVPATLSNNQAAAERFAPTPAIAARPTPAVSQTQPTKSDAAAIPVPSRQIMIKEFPETLRTEVASRKQPGDFRIAAAQPEPVPLPPAAHPFKVIEEAGEIHVTVRRSKLIQLTTNIYRTAIVDPTICDIVQFSPNELSIIGRGVGSTHMTFWFEGGQKPFTYLVTVDPDDKVREQVEYEYQKLEDIVAELFPDSKVRLQVLADKLIVRGQAKDSEEAAQIMAMVRGQSYSGTGVGGAGTGIGAGPAARVLSDRAAGQTANQNNGLQVINMLRVPGVQQVALRVKIAELNRSAARGFGVDIAGNINFTNNARGSQLFVNSVLNMAVGAAGQPILAQFDGDDIQVGFRYLEQHGVVRLISEPTLVTMSGTAATFVAGGEFAVPTIVGAAGLNAVTTDFRSFGAIISFLPTVVDKDRIRLQIAPEFSQVNRDLAVGGTPGLTTRSVTTTVEMREGQTFAIAGLLEDNLRTSTAGNIPFLAKLLGKRDAAHNETELLILVTPDLVHPMDAEEVPPLPGFDVTEPDNWQFFIRGDIEGNPTRDYRYTVWPRLRQRYNSGGTSMISGPFGHGQ